MLLKSMCGQYFPLYLPTIYSNKCSWFYFPHNKRATIVVEPTAILTKWLQEMNGHANGLCLGCDLKIMTVHSWLDERPFWPASLWTLQANWIIVHILFVSVFTFVQNTSSFWVFLHTYILFYSYYMSMRFEAQNKITVWSLFLEVGTNNYN